jgi:hypothetical protein
MGNKNNTVEAPAGSKKEQKGGIKEFFSLGEIGGYFFRKKDPSRPNNINLKMMHGVNKISIAIFLAGVLYLIFKLVIKPRL